MVQFTATADRVADATAEERAALGAAQRTLAARLERLPITRTHWRSRLIVGMATFFDGFDALAIAFVMPVLAVAWKLTPAQTGMLISGAYVGQVLGALFFPWFAEQFGRLRATAYSAGLFGLASLLCGFSWSPPSLLIARFVQGCGLGGEVPVAATYINEIARAPSRGRFFLMYETAFAVGYIGAASTGLWLVPNFGWQSIFFVGALPAIVAAVMRRLLPESPRWLASKGRVAEADAIVTRMEGEAEAALGHPLPAPSASAVPPVEGRRTRFREMFALDYRTRTILVWTLWFCQFFTTQGLNTWLPTIYRTQLHLTVHETLQYSFLNYALGIGSALTVALLLDRTGRRLWFALALPLGSLPLLILAGVGVTSVPELMILAWLSQFCHSTCSVSLYVYTPELFPTRMRAFAVGTSATARNIGASLSPTLIGIVLGSAGISYVFLMLGLVPLIGAAMVAIVGTETKGRVLEEISP
ncbi:MAG TPA: MFS transporter [Stellaceae bacterium]|nr:MFS transporter [Stellaceae bacterium]